MFSFYPDTNSSRALARYELRQIEKKIEAAIKLKMDAGSLAHLTMLQERIKKLLDANVLLGRP